MENLSADFIMGMDASCVPALEDEQRKHMNCGETLYVTFEGKVMHFFNPETQMNMPV